MRIRRRFGMLRCARNPLRAHWDGPVELGRGWLGFRMVTALLPSAPVAPR
jgi:hypothetical protein